jgi:hypothetical protein
MVVEAVVKLGLLWAQMGSGKLHSDLPTRHYLGSDVVSGPLGSSCCMRASGASISDMVVVAVSSF